VHRSLGRFSRRKICEDAGGEEEAGRKKSRIALWKLAKSADPFYVLLISESVEAIGSRRTLRRTIPRMRRRRRLKEFGRRK